MHSSYGGYLSESTNSRLIQADKYTDVSVEIHKNTSEFFRFWEAIHHKMF